MRPAFLITIDTEGDDLWSRPRDIRTENARHLPRFQTLCERYALKPTYLTNYEMAIDRAYIEFARDANKRNTAEIGMHLHAWNSPPIEPLTSDDFHHQPYLCEYPERIIREKVHVMTQLLGETFGAPLSHRAGRWAMSPTYAKVLVDEGYLVDCSVTPGVSWLTEPGDPTGSGGTDYTSYPDCAYFVDLDDLRRPGTSSLLEVPMTTRARRRHALLAYLPAALKQSHAVRKGLDKVAPVRWLRPRGYNRRDLLRLVDEAVDEGRDYVEFMLHSSELMPGGSPTFRSKREIDALYDDMEALFSSLRGRFIGETMTEYHGRYAVRAAA